MNSISIPNDVEVVEFYAFYNTPWYNTLPDGMVYFGKTAYEYKGEMAGNTKISIEDGTVYVSGQAFYGKDRLVEIVFPTSLSHIGFEALCDCSGLKSIIIPKNVNVIEDEAFASCSNLSTIIVFNENPIKLGFPNSTDTDSNSFVFYGVDKQNCKLYVPEGSVELYKAASEWNEFENILPISSSSINNPKLYDKTNNVYDINGLKRGNKAHKGLNIIRQSNGETKKVIVK